MILNNSLFKTYLAHKVLAVSTGVLSLLALSTPGSSAITGGEKTNSPYVVQLVIPQGESEKPTRCTGTALNAEWVLTAAHCTEDAKTPAGISVFYSNDKQNPGEAISSRSYVEAGDADLALIQLSNPHRLPSYAKLAKNHQFTAGQTGFIYGYGRGFEGKTMDWLRRAQVEQVYTGHDSYWNTVYKLKGIDGTSNHGDSGGPFFVNDQLVGVNVTGSHAADFYPNEVSGSMQLAPFVPWIEHTAGVKAHDFVG